MKGPALWLCLALCFISGLAFGEGRTYPAPSDSPYAFAVSGEQLYILDAKAGAVWFGPPDSPERVPITGRPKALGSNERGQGVIITSDAKTGFKAQVFAGTKLLRSVALKTRGPLVSVADVSSKADLFWLIQQTPPLALLFASDGEELARVDLAGRARAPFSLVLGQSGEAYVADPIGRSILELDSFGQFKSVHSLAGTGVTRPTSIALGAAGELWIGDTILGEAILFTHVGNELVAESSTQPLKVEDPLRLSTSSGYLWVLHGWKAAVTRLPAK